MQTTLQKEELLSLVEPLVIDNLIDSDWRQQPVHSWNKVYDNLCKDLGQHYGLNDIRDTQE